LKDRIKSRIDPVLMEIRDVAGYIWERGWSEKNAGNISVLLPLSMKIAIRSDLEKIRLEKPLYAIAGKSFYVTGTGKRMRDIARSPLDNGLFVLISSAGDGYYTWKETDSDIHPTSELISHLGIHNIIAERGSSEKAVVHTHATEIIALSQYPGISGSDQLNAILWGIHPENMIFLPTGIGLLPYMLPGSREIAEATVNEFRQHKLVVWQKHGVFAIGESVQDAFDYMDIVCKSAGIWLLCKSAGYEPEGLTEKQLDDLRKLIMK
jgi:rhamnulose-1-phosphate aldolase